MRFRDDTRGVTVQIGAVMLFATIIIALALYQATVVPSQNADIEYTHSQQAETQLTDVRNALLSTAASGNTRASSVELGTGYPSRVFLMNPPPAAGTLRTGSHDNDTVQVSNVVATNPETADFVDGTWASSTKYLEYAPDYNEYDGAPTLRYEASMLSNVFPEDNTTVPLTDQVLVRGDTITLVALNGSMSTSRSGSVSVTPDAASAPYQRVQVEPETASDPVTVTVPTSVSASTFENQTELGDRANVSVVDGGDDQVEIRLSGDGPYTLQTARVDVGSDTSDLDEHYLTVVENDSDSVTVEARDEFNNPVSGATVSVNTSTPFGEVSNPFGVDSKVTDEDGRATFEAEEGESVTVALEVLDGGNAHERVSVNVDTTSSGNGGGPAGSVTYNDDAVANDGPDDDDAAGGVEFSVTNEFEQQVTITDVTIDPADETITWLDAGIPDDEGAARVSEVYIDGNERDGFVDYGGISVPRRIDLDLDDDANANGQNPVVSSGGTAEFYLYEFSTETFDTSVDMFGDDVNVTVRYRLDSQLVGESAFTATPAAAGQLDDASATSILPYASGQRQTLAFTLGSDLAAGQTVDVDVSDAQSTSPLRVDYQSSNVQLLQGSGNVSWTSQGSSDAVVQYTAPSGGATEGDTVVVRVTDVNTGPPADQNNPYSTSFTRSDGGVASDEFSAAFSDGTSELTSVSAADMPPGTGQTQTVSVELETALANGEQVVVDLSDAQGTSGSSVNYQGASASVTQGSGSIEDFTAGSDTAHVTYTSSGDSAGDTVEIELSGQTAQLADGEESATFTAGFSREDADTASATFVVSGTGTIGGTVVDADTSEVLENADVIVYEAGTNNVAGTTTTDANGEYDIEVSSTNDYDVEVDGSPIGYGTDSATGVQVTDGQTTTVDAELSPVTVFASSPDFGNNDAIDTTFDVADGENSVSFAMDLDESGNDWQTTTVTIDGTTYTLTAAAADDISANAQVDLLDASNYESVQQSELDQYESLVNGDSTVQNQNDAPSATVTVVVGER